MGVLDQVVRFSNAIITILGLTLVAYGGYLGAQCKSVGNIVTDASMGIGVIDLLLGLLVLSCGYRSLFILRLYGLIMSFLVVAEFVIAGLFLSKSSSVTSLSTCPGDSTFQKAADSLAWIILAIAVFQSLCLVLVFLQVCSVDKVSKACLLRGGAPHLSLTMHLPPLPRPLSHLFTKLQPFDENQYQEESFMGAGSDKYGALSDEGVPSATDRYKQKHASFYSKYGLK
jgi:hypothetical protein